MTTPTNEEEHEVEESIKEKTNDSNSTNSEEVSNREEAQLNKSIRLKNIVTFAVVNARSLAPKLDSLVENFEELDIAFAIVTETWFVEGPIYNQSVEELNLGHGIASICHNRKASAGRNTGGGVAIMAKKSLVSLANYPIKRNGCEIVVGKGRY